MEVSLSNIPYIASAMAQSNVMESVGTAMLSKSIDVASTGMADLTKAMELSVNPSLGSNFDVSI